MRLSRVSKRFQIHEAASLKELTTDLLHPRTAEPFLALNDVSFAIGAGEATGIVGRNGSGKSTLLKLIAGVMAPTSGEVAVDGRVCPLIELGAGFHPDLTGRENVFLNAALLGLRSRETRELLQDIIAFAELEEFMDVPVKRYSSGMYVRLSFAVAVHCHPDILLVDEALSVGDIQFQAKCLLRMQEVKAKGVTIIVASHNQSLIESFCGRALLLDHGHLVGDGTPTEIFARYSELTAPPLTTA